MHWTTRIVSIPHELNFCRHGQEVRRLTTHESLGRWIVWGHYACSHCRTMVFDHFEERPREALIAGRRLPVHPRT